jgi:hypothetical protein
MRRVVLMAALAAAACDQPPVKEIAAAEQQVERARAAGAERYAPERYEQARAALAVARQRVDARDYRGALSAANDAAESARGAIENTGPAKAASRSAADSAVAEVRSLLDRAAAERTVAVKAGVPRGPLAALDARAQRAAQDLAVAVRQLGAGKLAEVEPLLAELRTEVTGLPDLYREARTTWDSTHRPRARRGASSRRRSR